MHDISRVLAIHVGKIAGVQPPLPSEKKLEKGCVWFITSNRSRRARDFPGTFGKWFDWLLLVDLVENCTHVTIQIQALRRKPKKLKSLMKHLQEIITQIETEHLHDHVQSKVTFFVI